MSELVNNLRQGRTERSPIPVFKPTSTAPIWTAVARQLWTRSGQRSVAPPPDLELASSPISRAFIHNRVSPRQRAIGTIPAPRGRMWTPRGRYVWSNSRLVDITNATQAFLLRHKIREASAGVHLGRRPLFSGSYFDNRTHHRVDRRRGGGTRPRCRARVA